MKTRMRLLIIMLVALYAIPWPGAPVRAQIDEDGFNTDFILTDEDIFNADGMNRDQLIRFVKSKGRLAELIVRDIDGVSKPAADIIWRVARSYSINPKYLLVLLQKEQSLVEDPAPTQNQLDWAAGFAVCDSCSKDDPELQEFRGFANQLEWAAKQHREKYLLQLLTTGKTVGGKGIGISMIVDGMIVIPQNNATAMLYTYTPHIHGNKNLWRIWNRWFSLKFPNGTIAKGMPSEKIYMIRLGEKHEFLSPAVLLSMTDPEKIVEVSDTDLSSYPDGEPMRFPKYSLLREPSGAIYLLASDGKRRIANADAFRLFGFLEDDIIDVNPLEIADLPEAAPINEQTVFPQGALVKAPDSSTVWYVEGGQKYALQDEVILKLYFTQRPIVSVPQKTIDTYTDKGIYKLHNGELIKGSGPEVFVVEDGRLRSIPSEEIFVSMGWKWHNIITVPDRMIISYQTGYPVNVAIQQITHPDVLTQ